MYKSQIFPRRPFVGFPYYTSAARRCQELVRDLAAVPVLRSGSDPVGEIHKNELMRGDNLSIVRPHNEQHVSPWGEQPVYFAVPDVGKLLPCRIVQQSVAGDHKK